MFFRPPLPRVPSLVLALLLAGCGDRATRPDPVVSITIAPYGGTLPVDSTLQLSATPRNARGDTLAGVPVSWSSSDTAVATISEDGLVKAKASGLADMSATAGGVSASVPIRVPGLRIVESPERSDTIRAIPDRLLVLELRGPDGEPAQDQTVTFLPTWSRPAADCVPPPSSYVRTCSGAFGMYVRSGSGDFSTLEFGRTDARGRVAVGLRMGPVAGPAELEVHAPGLLRDTLRFTVRPGAAWHMVIRPADTAVYVGARYDLAATTHDRAGNVRADTVTFTAASGHVSVRGGALQALAPGRGLISARAPSLVDTARVSIVPPGAMAVYRHSGSITEPASLVLIGLDGSNARRLAVTMEQHPSGAPGTDWNPDGTLLVYADETTRPGGPNRLHTVDLAGTVARLPANPALFEEMEPVFSPDGAWIYYTGIEDAQRYSLWRIRPDGTGTERLTQVELSYSVPRASPSPDGVRLVYEMHTWNERQIRILDLRTGRTSSLSVPGAAPAWSPTSDLIAFVAPENASLRVIGPDGAGERTVSPPGRRYRYEVGWSPNGRYLLARGADTDVLELVDTESGTTLPLAFTSRMARPAWKP